MQVDLIKLSTFPVLKRFLGTDEGLEMKVINVKCALFHMYVCRILHLGVSTR